MDDIVRLKPSDIHRIQMRVGKFAFLENLKLGFITKKTFKRHKAEILSRDKILPHDSAVAKCMLSRVRPTTMPILFLKILDLIKKMDKCRWTLARALAVERMMHNMGTPSPTKSAIQSDIDRLLCISTLVPYSKSVEDARRNCLRSVPPGAADIILLLGECKVPRVLCVYILTFMSV
jgi:hypothetical protein